ncbi:hypothetical protein FEP92_00357 [Burkholderia multivorans]|nr:hypothetical protein [Burkholderia multivorans]
MGGSFNHTCNIITFHVWCAISWNKNRQHAPPPQDSVAQGSASIAALRYSLHAFYVYFLKYFAMFQIAIMIINDTGQKIRYTGSGTGATSQIIAVSGMTPNIKMCLAW